MPYDEIVEFRSRIPETKLRVQQAVVQATGQAYLEDIVPEAKRLSPVLTGHNASTIDADVEPTSTGVHAELYTASGYGGYLEVGTRKMKAQPYLWPAFNNNIDRLKQRIKAILRGG